MSIGLSYLGTFLNWHEYDSGYSPGGGCISPFSWSENTRWRRFDTLFMLSVRYYVGSGSLLENDRLGATMPDYNPWYGAEPVMAGETANPATYIAPPAAHRC
ncbi:MAG TPA: hypothetical protein VMU01_07430 [Rhizomicrobium sp.]|nr:hypothetical protein [Rhizomicrobium sp.]